MFVLNFYTNLSKTLAILGMTERDMITNVYRSACKVSVISCEVLMEIEISRQSFEKYSNVKFHENPSSGSREFP